MEQLAVNIKMFRELKQITRKEMAGYLGISEQALGKYEDGSVTPSIATLQKMADKLGVDIRAFFDASPHQIFNFYNSQYSGHIVQQHNELNSKILEKLVELIDKLSNKL
jgi:transcriptional regulator with XRE-family HTH domain